MLLFDAACRAVCTTSSHCTSDTGFCHPTQLLIGFYREVRYLLAYLSAELFSFFEEPKVANRNDTFLGT